MAKQKEIKMIVECPTHWPLVYDMLNQAVYLQDIIIAFISNQPEYSNLQLSAVEWE